MSNTVCIEKNTFLIGLIFVITATLLYLLYNKDNTSPFNLLYRTNENSINNNIKNLNNNVDSLKNTINKNNNKKIYLKNETETTSTSGYTDPLIERDYRAVTDPLAPPTRRLPRHAYPVHPSEILPIDVPTRGYPDNYHYVGNLVRKCDERIVKLFGRQTYPSSNRYEYYGIASDSNGSEIKVQIKSKNNIELHDKDDIIIEVLNPKKGSFTLFMNEFDRPRYNPYYY